MEIKTNRFTVEQRNPHLGTPPFVCIEDLEHTAKCVQAIRARRASEEEINGRRVVSR